MTGQEMLAQFLCLLLMLAGFLVAYRFLTRRPAHHGNGHEVALPSILCPQCSYDLRHTTEICPECGQPVPENLRLRAELREAHPPEWLLDPERALPLRQPEPDEPWKPILAVMALRQVRPLEALLDQAGIDHRSILTLTPRPNLLGHRREKNQPLAAVIEVPQADLPMAWELALHVRWMHETGELATLYEQLGLEPPEEALDEAGGPVRTR